MFYQKKKLSVRRGGEIKNKDDRQIYKQKTVGQKKDFNIIQHLSCNKRRQTVKTVKEKSFIEVLPIYIFIWFK